MRQLRADGWLRGRIILPALLVSAFVVVFVWGFVLTGRYAVDSTHAEHATQVSSSFPQRLWATLSLFTGGYLSLTPDYDPQPPTDLSIVGILALLLTLFAAGSLVLLSRRVRDFMHLVRPKAHLGVIGDGHTAAALIKSAIVNKIPAILITESRDSVAAMATTPAIPIIAAGELQAVLTTPTARRVISHAKRVVIATDSDGVNMQLHDEIQEIRAGQSEKYRGRTDLVIIHDPAYAELVRPDTITTTLPGNEVTCPAENIAEHICHLIVAAITGSPRIQRAVVDVVELPASTTTDQDRPGLAETIRIWVRRLSWSLAFVCDDDENPVPQIVLREPSDDDEPQEPTGLTIQIFTGPSSTAVAAAALPRRHALRIAVANRQLIAGAAKLRYADEPQTVTTGHEWLTDGRGLGEHPDATLKDLLLVVDPAETGLDAALVTDDTGTQWARTFSLTHTLMFSDGTWSVVGWQPGAPMGDSTRQVLEQVRRASLAPGRIAAAKAKAASQGRPWDENTWRNGLLREAKKKIGDRYSSKLAVDHMLTLLTECGFELHRHDGADPPPAPAMTTECQKYIAAEEHQDWLNRSWTDSSRYPWPQRPPWRAPEEIRLAGFSGVAANEFCYAGLVALENDGGWNAAQRSAERMARTLHPNLRKAARYNRRIATETYPAIAASFGYAIVEAGESSGTAPVTGRQPCDRPLCPCGKRPGRGPRTLGADEINDMLAGAPSYRSRIVVRAEPITAEANWVTARADSLHANSGDWWVSDGESGWSVAADVFTQTYEHLNDDRYLKTARVHAVQLSEPVLVQTLEGTATGHPGDWLVRNPGGECWPVTGIDFARRYERA